MNDLRNISLVQQEWIVDKARKMFPESYNQGESFVAHDWVYEAIKLSFRLGWEAGLLADYKEKNANSSTE